MTTKNIPSYLRAVKTVKNKSPYVSVLLLTKNAGNEFKDVLEIICNQILNKPFEIIMIDSASTDDTLSIAMNYPINIFQIPASEFGHGKTRNLAVNLSKGKFVVFLTQDATPCSTDWLQIYVNQFQSSKVAGIFGRQIPKPQSLPFDIFSYSKNYPDHDFSITKQNASKYSVVFSDVNAAINRDLLIKYPYPDDILVSEDVYWATTMLENGQTISYSASAAVVHSHLYSLFTIFKLNFDQGVGYSQSLFSGIQLSETSTRRFIEKIQYLLKNKLWIWIPYVMYLDIIRAIAIFLGMHHRYLPLFLNKRMGKLKYFWNSNAK